MTTFTSDDRQEAYKQKVEEAPYHPGYEDAVVSPKPTYKGMDPAKMIWKTNPLTHGEILNMYLAFTNGNRDLDVFEFARSIEERHGIK